MNTPDYKDVDQEAAFKDFTQRRENYINVYETVDESDGSYIKMINNQTYVVHNARGYLPQKVSYIILYMYNNMNSLCHITNSTLSSILLQVVQFVMNLHTLPRVFYLSRHGQSEYNLLGKIGGDAGLTEAGMEYARRLAVFARDHVGMEVVKDEETGKEKRIPRPARLWTSTLRRTKETAQFIKHEKIQSFKWDNGDEVEWIQFQGRARRNLDELYAGVCDGLTYKEIEEKYPEEFARRQEDKLSYRYPRGMFSILSCILIGSSYFIIVLTIPFIPAFR